MIYDSGIAGRVKDGGEACCDVWLEDGSSEKSAGGRAEGGRGEDFHWSDGSG